MFGNDKKELPIGIEDFKVLIDNNYYFVDKTLFLRDLMHRFGKVSLFTRPRRFGKTLNMSMIRYFFEQSEEDHKSKFFHAVLNGDAKTIERELNSWMNRSISYHDGYENYYHGFLVGLLQYSEQYLIESNRESGTGRSDIFIKDTLNHEIAVVIEAKAADTEAPLEQECRKALKQIEEKQYANGLLNEGYPKIVKYGIAFYQKYCKVMLG